MAFKVNLRSEIGQLGLIVNPKVVVSLSLSLSLPPSLPPSPSLSLSLSGSLKAELAVPALGLTDYSQRDILGSWKTFVIFGSRQSWQYRVGGASGGTHASLQLEPACKKRVGGAYALLGWRQP